jgi:hypothetical protein
MTTKPIRLAGEAGWSYAPVEKRLSDALAT